MCNPCEGYLKAQRKQEEFQNLSLTSRRQLLIGLAGVGLAGSVFAQSQSSTQLVMGAKPGSGGKVLVVLFLRGGMDGLSAVVPYLEDAYHKARPGLRLGAPNDSSLNRADRTLDLDGKFGLHPAFESLLPLFEAGNLAIVHGVGSNDHTRSHFEAMGAMERGVSRATDQSQGGWLARYLSNTATKNSGIRAVALGSPMPDSLRGAPGAVGIEDLENFKLRAPDGFSDHLESLYGLGKDAFSDAGRATLRMLKLLNQHDWKSEKARFPTSGLGETFSQLSSLIRADVGLEVATVEKGGWDTHVAQGVGQGYLALQFREVAEAISAFWSSLGQDQERVTLVLQTEFGRRLEENAGLGTDHGRASVMMVLGKGVKGGKIHGAWGGLDKGDLEDGIDLKVTTDYRQVLASVLGAQGRPVDLAEVFPSVNLSPMSLY